MYYYNPETNTKKSSVELSTEYNVSIPNKKEAFQGYYPIYYGAIPTITMYQNVVEGPIQFVDGQYCINYSVEYKSVETLREMKMNEVDSKFEKVTKSAWVMSSCGFKINAGEVAYRDVEGLIKVMEVDGYDEELFKDYNNEFQSVTLSDLKTMHLEIIKNAQNLYKQKWKFISDLESLTTEREIIDYTIAYKNMDFYNV